MKGILYSIVVTLLFTTATNSQTVTNFLDADKKPIPEETFTQKWKDKKSNVFRWDYMLNANRIATLKPNVYNYYKIKNDTILKQLNKISVVKYKTPKLFFIEFIYANDLCSNAQNPNNWTKERLLMRSYFLDRIKNDIKAQYKNSEFLVLFEKELQIDGAIKEIDYFRIDNENFFRKNFFTKPAMCGSILIINTDGYALQYNGEHKMEELLVFLKPKVWKKIFQNN